MSSRPASRSSIANPTLKSLAEGQVLCREGDPPGPLYVILSGSVRAYRRGTSTPEGVDELATLGPGDIVGELAALLQQVRTATVEAAEPTNVLEVPAGQVRNLLRQHNSLVRVLAVALKDRAGLTPAEVQSIVLRQGALLPADLLDGDESDTPNLTFAVPAHDPANFYPKALTCPVCEAKFSVLVVHVQKDQPAERSTDFHHRYRTEFNPYDYEVWVCPNDLYAGLPTDFAEISNLQRPRVAEVVASVVAGWGGERPDFNVDRTFRLREQSLELAIAQYRMRNIAPLRQAAILHRLAWCARERGDTEAERTWLAQALQAYSTAYNQDEMENPKIVLRVLYLCGELNTRLGDQKAAIRWFSEGVRHPKIKEHPHWERMLREQWSNVRAAVESGDSTVL
jgi:uncharacterized protein (DUF2225 family)